MVLGYLCMPVKGDSPTPLVPLFGNLDLKPFLVARHEVLIHLFFEPTPFFELKPDLQ